MNGKCYRNIKEKRVLCFGVVKEKVEVDVDLYNGKVERNLWRSFLV